MTEICSVCYHCYYGLNVLWYSLLLIINKYKRKEMILIGSQRAQSVFPLNI